MGAFRNIHNNNTETICTRTTTTILFVASHFEYTRTGATCIRHGSLHTGRMNISRNSEERPANTAWHGMVRLPSCVCVLCLVRACGELNTGIFFPLLNYFPKLLLYVYCTRHVLKHTRQHSARVAQLSAICRLYRTLCKYRYA